MRQARMYVELTNPIALVLLALIPLALYLARHSLANLSRRRAAASIATRIAILLCVVLALAGLRLRTASRDLALIFVVDVSASVAPDEQRRAVEFINQQIEAAGARDFVGIVAFGRDAVVELAPVRKENLGDWKLTELSSNPARDYTNAAGALRLAAALVPESAVGRLILISDGNENLENASAEALLLRASEIEVFTRSMATMGETRRGEGEIAVRDLIAPERLAEGEAFDLRIVVDSTVDTEAVLRVFRNDTLTAERRVALSASGENIFLVPQRNDEKGFYTYRAEIEATGADLFTQNNAREAFAIVEGRPKILYLYGDSRPSTGIERVLAEGNFAADIRGAGGVPSTLAGFQDYDLVIFDNLPAAQLTNEQMKMVRSYVRDLGGGFLMIGGEQSFGPGGYYKTSIEEVLPVSLDVRQKKHFPSLALVLVIDRSGSMSGEKIQLAREAAIAAVDFLSERDRAGVIAFDDQAHAVVPLTEVTDKPAITNKIRSIQIGGGTNMYPGLRQAYEWLLASDAQIKHIISLSDGQSEDGNFEGIAEAIRNAGMTLSTVAVGDDADEQLMEMLAQAGGGRFYATNRAENLPRIFTREAFLASRSTIIEEPFTPQLVRSAQATSGIDWAAAPRLGGYVGTAERDPASTPAITSLVTDKDDPVYAVWQYGLGRAAAFTSDAKPRWAAGWMNWSGYGQFWTQVLRDTLRREGASDLTPRVEIDAGRGHIIVEAITPEGGFRNNLRLRARVVTPDLQNLEVPLEQTAAGRYEGNFTATTRGAYLVSVLEEGGSAAPITGSVNSYSPEFRIAGADATLLSAISEATGGRLLSADGEPDAGLLDRTRTRTQPREIWDWLLLAALLLLPVDVGIRRVHITREQIDEWREWLAERLRRPQLALDLQPAASLAQLKVSRSRVQLGSADVQLPEPVVRSEAPAAPPLEPPARESAKPPASSPVVPSLKIEKSGETKEAVEDAKPLASRLLDARRKKRNEG